MDTMDLRGIEHAKNHCERIFQLISSDKVSYNIVDS